MSDIGVFITGDRELALRFERFPAALHAKLLQRISGLTSDLEALVESQVPRRTGKLAGEITARIRDSDASISGIVTLTGDYAKAAALEYGAHGIANVSAHAARLTHLWGRATGAPLTVEVPTHTRHVNISAHRFLRGPEAQMIEQVRAELQSAVDETLSEDL